MVSRIFCRYEAKNLSRIFFYCYFYVLNDVTEFVKLVEEFDIN